MKVRAVRAEDWPALRDVRLAALLESPLAFGRSHAEEAALPESAWRAWAADGNRGGSGATFVAEDEGRLVGLASTYDDRDTGGVSLGAMWVAPEARGRGAGRALVEACVAWARERGLPRLDLWVNDDNAPARRLYEACGFLPTGEDAPQRWRPERRVLLLRRVP